jgi:vancomycin resistance protein VanJ
MKAASKTQQANDSVEILDSWLSGKLARIAELAQTAEGRKHLRVKISMVLCRLLLVAILGYAASLLVLIVLMKWVGERNVTTAFLLYLPPTIWLLPVPVLGFIALLIRKRHLASLLLITVAAAYSLFEFRSGEEPILAPSDRPENSLTVLSYNSGQNRRQSLQPFKNLCQPDVLVFQDSRNRATKYLNSEGYTEFTHAESIAEYTLVSKFPILSKESFNHQRNNRPLAFAARFVIDFHGQPVSIYAVHYPTPRDLLLHFRKGAFLVGVLGFPGSPFASSRKKYQGFWDYNIEMTKEIIERSNRDPNPVIVAGDFNAPSLGYIHSLLSDSLTDAHAEVGNGSGHTFPGATNNPLSLFGPWMRIDYLFCNDKLQPLWCLTEKNRPSQHRAVTASFKLLGD